MEKEMATHSSILAWEIPWIEEPGRLRTMGLQKVGHNWMAEHALTHKKAYTCCAWNCYIFQDKYFIVPLLSCLNIPRLFSRLSYYKNSGSFTSLVTLLSVFLFVTCLNVSPSFAQQSWSRSITSYFLNVLVYN